MQFDNSLPIYQQVVTAIKKEIAAGRIAPGDKLPSCRDLAVQYRINPNTAARGLLADMRKEMADGYTRAYIRDMADLGYHRNEILHCLEDWDFPEEEHTDLSGKE